MTPLSEQVNVILVLGHTVTCPSLDSTDEEITIPLVLVDKTAIAIVAKLYKPVATSLIGLTL